MANHTTVTIHFKADTSELDAAIADAEDRIEKLYAKLARVRRSGRVKGGSKAATRETR